MRFTQAIRERPQFRDSWLVLVCERNTGHESGFLADPFKKLHPKNIAVAQYEDGDYGWWTEVGDKQKYAFKTRECMMVGAMCFMKDWICTNPWLRPEERHKTTRAKFEEQIKRVRPVMTQPKEPHSTPRMTISGKVDKEGKISGTFRDDLAMSLLINIYVGHMLQTNQVPNFPYSRVFRSQPTA
jgi:hypothetical protein